MLFFVLWSSTRKASELFKNTTKLLSHENCAKTRSDYRFIFPARLSTIKPRKILNASFVSVFQNVVSPASSIASEDPPVASKPPRVRSSPLSSPLVTPSSPFLDQSTPASNRWPASKWRRLKSLRFEKSWSSLHLFNILKKKLRLTEVRLQSHKARMDMPLCNWISFATTLVFCS